MKKYTSEEKAKVVAKGEERLGKQHFFGINFTSVAVEKEQYEVSYAVELDKILKSLKNKC